MSLKLCRRTRRLVEKIFRQKRVAGAVHWLEDECGNNLPACEKQDEYHMERIRFAEIKLSGGNIQKLPEAMDGARMDWRDPLMAADFVYDVNAHGHWAKEIF